MPFLLQQPQSHRTTGDVMQLGSLRAPLTPVMLSGSVPTVMPVNRGLERWSHCSSAASSVRRWAA
jgi:hypothetical protein